MVGLIILVVVLAAVAVFFWYMLFAPRVGSDPKGDRKARILASPSQAKGLFQNPVPTDMNMPGRTMRKVMWQMLKGDPAREPRNPIPVVPFDKSAFEAASKSGFALTWFGHSSLLISLDGVTFLCDPVFGKRPSPFPFLGPKRFPYTEYMRVNMLPQVDVVLLSHDHFDHLCHETIVRLRDKKFICPLGVGAHLERWGVPAVNIQEYDRWDSVAVRDVTLTLLPTRHFSGRKLSNRFTTLWGAWVLQGKSKRILFGADTAYFDGFKAIGERFGGYDLVLLECGAYNENWPHVHMFPEETAQAAAELKARVLMPIHWGKFSLALHPWKEPIERVSVKAAELGIPLLTPRPGRILTSTDPSQSEKWWKDLS